MFKKKTEPKFSKPVNLEDYITWVLLLQTRDVLFQARKNELSQYGISPEQAAVLYILHTIGYRPTPTDISQRMLRKPHTVSALLSRMERKGLVSRTKNSIRKNLVRVELTEKGHEAYSQLIKRESIHKIMSSLSEEDSQQLKSYLRKLRDEALKELGWERKMPFPSSQ